MRVTQDFSPIKILLDTPEDVKLILGALSIALQSNISSEDHRRLLNVFNKIETSFKR